MRRIKIAVIHPRLVTGGGSESTALWTAEALKNDFEVSLITMGPIDLPALNNCFGTSLASGQLKTISIPLPAITRNRFMALRGYRLAKFCREYSRDYDLMFSSYNVMDFGRRGIQYIADFSFDENVNRSLNPNPRGLNSIIYRKTLLRRAYLGIAKMLSGNSQAGWLNNFTISNSEWTRDLMIKYFGLESCIIYHPVVNSCSHFPWAKRDNGFVCIGRIVPEKNLEGIIEILGHVRQKGHDIHLHIHGNSNDRRYLSKIRKLCQKNSPWVFLGEGIFGQNKNDLISRHRYGLHGRQNEPFGIAVAEMIKAGSIIWVPYSGGPREIVNHSDLIYKSKEDAFDKIVKVLENPVQQTKLNAYLLNRAKEFSPERFTREIREVIKRFIDNKALKPDAIQLQMF